MVYGMKGISLGCCISSLIFSGLVQVLCQLEANGVAVLHAEHAGPQDRIALALYPTVSMMNHACAYNVALQFAGCSLSVR